MTHSSKPPIPELASIGIDIGKDVFHIIGFDLDGQIVVRRKFKRLSLMSEFEKQHAVLLAWRRASAHIS